MNKRKNFDKAFNNTNSDREKANMLNAEIAENVCLKYFQRIRPESNYILDEEWYTPAIDIQGEKEEDRYEVKLQTVYKTANSISFNYWAAVKLMKMKSKGLFVPPVVFLIKPFYDDNDQSVYSPYNYQLYLLMFDDFMRTRHTLKQKDSLPGNNPNRRYTIRLPSEDFKFKRNGVTDYKPYYQSYDYIDNSLLLTNIGKLNDTEQKELDKSAIKLKQLNLKGRDSDYKWKNNRFKKKEAAA